ncbi:MAG: hypothetical protein ACE5JU_24640 [Candidatus Binatia bacterium]
MTVETTKTKSRWLERGVRYHIHRNNGHPWTGENGWDGMAVEADTEDALSDFISATQRKFWAVWIRDNTGNKRAFLYKPQGASAPLRDP